MSFLSEGYRFKALLAGLGFLAVLFILSCIFLYWIMPSRKMPSTHADDQWVTIKNSKIRYRLQGVGNPTIVFLHGFGGSLNEWDALLPLIGCTQKVSLDMVGFGASDTYAAKYDLPGLSSLLIEFMDRLELGKVVLVGASMGGSLAAWTAAHHPERVTGLVLFAPSGYPGSFQPGFPKQFFYKPGWVNKIGTFVVSTKVYKTMFPDSKARQALEVTGTYNAAFARALRNIKQKTVLVWSTGDNAIPYVFHQKYLEAIQDITFIERPAKERHPVHRHQIIDTASRLCDLVKTIKNSKGESP